MNTNIQFIQTTPEQLAHLITESVKSQINELKTSLKQQDIDVLMTRTQACEFLQIDSSTLWHWTKKGKVSAYGIANRRYYKKSDLLNSLKPLLK